MNQFTYCTKFVHDAFKKYDINHNNTLDKSEIKLWLKD